MEHRWYYIPYIPAIFLFSNFPVQRILQILHKYEQNLHIVKSPKYELYL